MRIALYALSAALLGFMSAGSANAMPSSMPAKAAFQSETVQLVDHRPGHNGYRKYNKRKFKGRRHGHKHYRPGGRYSVAPRGWRRYDRRPSYWRTRGCIVVGPIWFCP